MTEYGILCCIIIGLTLALIEFVALFIVTLVEHRRFVKEVRRDYKKIDPPDGNGEMNEF